MKKLLNLVLTGMLLTVLSFGTAIVANATEGGTGTTDNSGSGDGLHVPAYTLEFRYNNEETPYTIQVINSGYSSSTIDINNLVRHLPADAIVDKTLTDVISSNTNYFVWNNTSKMIELANPIASNDSTPVNITLQYGADDSFSFVVSSRQDNIPCNISKSEPENGFTYDGTEKKPTISVSYSLNNETITLAENTDYECICSDYINAGSKSISVSGKGITSGSNVITYEIKKANNEYYGIDISGKFTDLCHPYNGSLQDLIAVNDTVLAKKLSYSFEQNGTYSQTIPQKKDVYTGNTKNEYTIYYKISGDDNHNELTGTTVGTIVPKTITVYLTGIPISKAQTYDGSLKSVAPSEVFEASTTAVDKELFTNDKVTITYSADKITYGPEAGTYQINFDKNKFIASNADNFIIKYDYTDLNKAKYTINKAKFDSVTMPDGTSFTYTGDYNPSYTPTMKFNGANVSTEDVTFAYGSSKGSYNSKSSRMYKSVGSNYNVYYKITSDNFEDYEGVWNFSIIPKEVTLSWTNTSLRYTGSAQAPKATAGGVVSGDTCTVTVTGAQSAVGTYTATASSLSNSNYKLPSNNTTTYTIAATSTATTTKTTTTTTPSTIKSVGSTSTTKSSSTTTGTTNKSSSSTSNSGSSSNKSTSSSTGSVSGSSSTGSSSSSLGSSSSSDLLTSNSESALDLGPSTSTLEAGSSSGVSEGTLDEEALADGWLEAEEDDVYYDSHAVDSDMYDAAPDMSYARAAHLASPESTGTILGLVFGIAVCCMIAGIIFVILHFRKAKSQL